MTTFVLVMFILFCVNSLLTGVLFAIDIAAGDGEKAPSHLFEKGPLIIRSQRWR